MMRYEYLVVPFQGQIKGSGSVQDVSNQLQNIINHHAAQGWEFYTLNDVNIQVTPGCLASLTGSRTSYVAYDQLIFRRPVGG